MATRDLSVTYLRLRSALHRKAPGREVGDATGTGLLGSSGASGGVDTTPLALAGAAPIYVEMVNEITNDMNTIQSKSAWAAARERGSAGARSRARVE